MDTGELVSVTVTPASFRFRKTRIKSNMALLYEIIVSFNCAGDKHVEHNAFGRRQYTLRFFIDIK